VSKLNIKPIKAGVTIALAYENGLIYAGDLVAIDLEKYRQSLLEAYASSRGLSILIGYVTKDTAPEIIAKAYREAVSLAVEAGVMTPETGPRILARAEAEASALMAKAKEKGFQ
jgi:large subunit ribosomal protein L10